MTTLDTLNGAGWLLLSPAQRLALKRGFGKRTQPVDPEQALIAELHSAQAAGDIAAVIAHPRPKAGVFAHGEAEVVANNIARVINGTGETERFTGHGACFIETGAGKAGFGSGNFYAEPTPRIALRRVADAAAADAAADDDDAADAESLEAR